MHNNTGGNMKRFVQTKKMNVKDKDLYLGSYKLADLAKTYKTPLIVVDENHLREKLDIFKNYFKSDKYECMTIYASKAFYCPYLAHIIDSYGFGIDSVSHGDLYMLKKSHFPFSKVVLHGNYKTDDELRFALINGVGLIVVDNLDEMIRLDNITKEVEVKADVLLRVNPGIEAHTHEYIQTSLLSSKFGESIYDTETILKIVDIAKSSKYIDFHGFHCHIGSSINKAASFEDATNVMLKFLKEIEDKSGATFDILNLGGGFGIKYLDSDTDINLEEMLKTITKTVDKFVEANNIKLKKLLIEPGRSIISDSAFTLYTASITKHTYGKKNYLFVDGGMTDNIRPSLYKAQYSLDNASNMNGEKVLVDVVGPCCESGDIVAKDVYVQEAKPGDTIVVYATGAYTYSMSSNYNGATRPEVLFIKDDIINVGVKRETMDDLMKSYPKEKEYKVFDCHSDMLFDLWQKKIKGKDDEFTNFHVNQLETSLVHGALWTMYSEFDFDLIEACKIALAEIRMDKLSNMEVILGLEGLRNLKKVEDIDILYDMGFRHAMLTWNEENMYATGAKSEPTHGLKEEGVKLLKRMEELGMIIDLAHTNEKSFYDILNVVSKNIIYSHGLCKALCNHPRNLTDDQMRALKAKDGLFGITLASSFIAEDKDKRTMERFLEHIKHAISIMGIDNICFGFDFMDYLDAFANSNLVDIADATKLDNLIIGLKSIGLNDEEIDKITWSNFYNRYKHLVVLKGSKK